jgi:hypothetical protein
MKIILSRKGFDSEYGGQPSPILPNGELLSLPIPSKYESAKYSQLFYEKKSYYQIIKDLKPNSSIKETWTCHLDPDIRYSALKRDYQWRPVFGQADAAQSHLRNNNITLNDLFLFYGWFKSTELSNGKYSYVKDAPDLHVIFGYFQIGEIFNQMTNLPNYAKYHPHAGDNFSGKINNCIYVANEFLTLSPGLKGASKLNFNENLVLTKNGLSRSKWNLPEFFNTLDISYHNKESFKENYFQSAAKGQEFVIEANEELIKWVKRLVTQ